jgi:hypothetical protein
MLDDIVVELELQRPAPGLGGRLVLGDRGVVQGEAADVLDPAGMVGGDVARDGDLGQAGDAVAAVGDPAAAPLGHGGVVVDDDVGDVEVAVVVDGAAVHVLAGAVEVGTAVPDPQSREVQHAAGVHVEHAHAVHAVDHRLRRVDAVDLDARGDVEVAGGGRWER